MKKCSKCGEVKNESEFYKHKNLDDKLHGQCKECMSADMKVYYQKNKDRLKEKAKIYLQNNKEIIARKRKKYNTNFMQARRKGMKDQVYQLLGGYKCSRCGFSDERALQIDHIDGNGKEERRMYPSGKIIYFQHILDVGGVGYQVLCANCNWIKRYENLEYLGVCKHRIMDAQKQMAMEF